MTIVYIYRQSPIPTIIFRECRFHLIGRFASLFGDPVYKDCEFHLFPLCLVRFRLPLRILRLEKSIAELEDSMTRELDIYYGRVLVLASVVSNIVSDVSHLSENAVLRWKEELIRFSKTSFLLERNENIQEINTCHLIINVYIYNTYSKYCVYLS